MTVTSSSLGTGYYSVSANSCASTAVYIQFKPYAGPQDPVYNQITPISYCKARVGDLLQTQSLSFVSSTTYNWIVSPSGATIVHSNATDNFAAITFPANYSGTTATITATMNEDGCINSAIYSVGVSSPVHLNAFTYCTSQLPFTINANISTAAFEYWDFGAGANVNSSGSQYYTNTVTTGSNNITVSYSTSGTRIAKVEYYNTYSGAECHTGTIDYTINSGCRVAEQNNQSSLETNVATKPEKIQFAPNPANSEVRINAVNKLKSVEIYNLSGVILKKIGINGSNSVIIKTHDLLPGLYTCKVITSSGIKYLKLLIQR